MELRGYFQLLLRRWPVLIVTALVAMGIGYTTTDRTAQYQSTSLLLVSPERFDLATEGANISLDRISVIDRLLLTYSRMIKSDTVAAAAAHRLSNTRSPDSIIGATQAVVIPQTQLLSVIVTDRDPSAARDINNAVAQSFIDAANAAPSTTGTGVIPGGVPVTLFEQARLPVAPLGTRLISNLILAGAFGLLLAAGACIAADAFDLSVRSVRDTERRLGVPVIGSIPPIRGPQRLTRRPREPDGPPENGERHLAEPVEALTEYPDTEEAHA